MFNTMLSDIRSSNEYLESVADRKYSLEIKSNSVQQQSSKTVKERFLSPRRNRSVKSQDKLKVENLIDQPYVGRHRRPRRNVEDETLLQPKSSENHQKQSVRRKTMKDDELVKHMSNLPSYLQRVDKVEDVQEKALNFGVLNWERLEKWKTNQKLVPDRGSINASSSSSNRNSSLSMTIGSSIKTNTVHSETLAYQDKQHCSPCSNTNSSRKGAHSQGVKLPRGKVVRIQDFETAPKGYLDGQKKIPWTESSCGRNYPEKVLEKGKRKDLAQKGTSEMGAPSSNLRNYGVTPASKEKLNTRESESKKKAEELQESDIKRKTLDQRITSEVGTSLSGVSVRSKEKMSVCDGETKKRVVELQESEKILTHQHSPGEHEKIVLLLPRDLSQSSFSEVSQLSDPRLSLDDYFSEAYRTSCSDGFSSEVRSAEYYSEIPHSCPLPCRTETSAGSDVKPCSVTGAEGMERPSDASSTFSCSNEMYEGKYAQGNKIKSMDSIMIGSSKRFEQESTERSPTKGRNPSPNRRFSIGLGRMSRSLSFKEGSAIPQLNSTYVSVKSGPVSSETSTCLDIASRDKAKATSRARSSPLRRLLDPLLKPKATETVQLVKPNSNPLRAMQINASESLENLKHKATTVHALLQFTIKNGLPLFKFVVDNNINVLAATVANLSTSLKDDSSRYYTFCSVNEIKKKNSGWMNQGSKGQNCGYVYNVVGQMKISSPHASNLAGQNSNMVRESILFGAEPRQVDREMPKLMSNKELAAIVVEAPSEDSSHDKDDRCSCGKTTVILPGGVHGLPNKGAPSPLLYRWGSGGSCDCGGWDLGCKLYVLSTQDQFCKCSGKSEAYSAPTCLSNHDQCCKCSGQSETSSAPDYFQLFLQGGAQVNKTFFSLAPVNKGIYSVRFKASISLLQAFFIGVTLINCQKPCDLTELSDLPEASGDDRIKTSGDVPAKYIPFPPPSPAGRV